MVRIYKKVASIEKVSALIAERHLDSCCWCPKCKRPISKAAIRKAGNWACIADHGVFAVDENDIVWNERKKRFELRSNPVSTV